MPFIVDAPTLEGEIKKARAANYTWLRVIAEFIDNSFDAIIKKSKSGNVRLTFGLDTNDTLKSISISDNCEVGFYDPNAWSWTYKRERTEEDCGEFGTGFKSGSVNISSKLICYTNINGNYKKMIADWEDMSRENSFTPEFSEITEDKYNSFHPYGHGTTFLMKDLIYTTIPCDYNHIREKVIYFLKTTYKKKLRDNKHLSIEVCSSNDTQEKITVIDYTNIVNEIFSKKITNYEPIEYCEIHVFKNIKGEIVPIIKKNYTAYRVLFKNENNHRNQNGNIWIRDMRGGTYGAEIVNLSDYQNKEEFTQIDILKIWSRCIYHLTKKWFMNNNALEHPNGNMSLIRKDRTLSDKFTCIRYRNDSYAEYNYHELLYSDRRMDNLLGVQFNKSTESRVQSEELEAAIYWIQKRHEKIVSESAGGSASSRKYLVEGLICKHKKIVNKNANYNIKQRFNMKLLFDTWYNNINWISVS